MQPTAHLIKLCVGAEAVEDLTDWQSRVIEARRHAGEDACPVHVTRMWPKRADEILRGGSLYWVFKGLVLARQRIVRFEPRVGGDGVKRCAIVLDHRVVRTTPQPRRPFQGWRYLRPEDAPRDLLGATPAGMSTEMMAKLAEIGVL